VHQRSAANRFVVFGSPHALEKSRAVMDGDDAMHPPLILFDYRTREFEPTRRSFDFIDVTGAERAPQRCRCTEFRYESVMQKRLCA
jgi:hypothetical protein